jgi:protein regulator of cytokinesis 1
LLTVPQYEVELERCLELRRSSLSSFIVGARKEIEMLWAELMMSDDEKSDFGAFINGEPVLLYNPTTPIVALSIAES